MGEKKAKPSDTFGRIRIAKCCANCEFFEEEGTMNYAWWCGLEGFETFHAEIEPHLYVCELFSAKPQCRITTVAPDQAIEASGEDTGESLLKQYGADYW